ncbi:MAG: hypothetical protein PHU63_04470, partial [Candidatus ainarchaeum sp.]|nr:hypothetical protein [Candidatus ainarchaeum sp.]
MDLKDKYLLALVFLGLVNTLVVVNVINEFKQLPSPLFGGDFYFQLGGVYHVYDSSPLDWFKSSNMVGELPAYLPTYAIATTIFGKIFAFPPMQAMFYLNYILPFASVFIFYFMIKEWINSSELALLGTAALVTYQQFPILKYTDFTSLLIVPFFFYSLILFFKERNQKNAI